MSGIEVVGLVTGIVSAFVGAASYLNERKKMSLEKNAKHKAGKRHGKVESLHDAVVAAPSQIQGEYDDRFKRIGPLFAEGDHIARMQLTRILIDMLNVQQRMMDVMRDELLVSNGSMDAGDFASLAVVVKQLREDSISALAQQFQRLSGATVPRGMVGLGFDEKRWREATSEGGDRLSLSANGSRGNQPRRIGLQYESKRHDFPGKVEYRRGIKETCGDRMFVVSNSRSCLSASMCCDYVCEVEEMVDIEDDSNHRLDRLTLDVERLRLYEERDQRQRSRVGYMRYCCEPLQRQRHALILSSA